MNQGGDREERKDADDLVFAGEGASTSRREGDSGQGSGSTVSPVDEISQALSVWASRFWQRLETLQKLAGTPPPRHWSSRARDSPVRWVFLLSVSCFLLLCYLALFSSGGTDVQRGSYNDDLDHGGFLHLPDVLGATYEQAPPPGMDSCPRLPHVGGPVTPRWSRKQQPDVHIFGVSAPNGTHTWYLSATGNLLMPSSDLCSWGGPRYDLFPKMPHVTDVWAPQIARIGGRLIMTFTARNLSSCPPGVKPHICRTCYWAEVAELPQLDTPPPSWRPRFAAGAILNGFAPPADCPPAIANSLPRSFARATKTPSPLLVGLDSHLWQDDGDGGTGQAWLSWSANSAVPRAPDGLDVQSLGIARVEPGTLQVACEAGNIIYPILDVQQWERKGSAMRAYCEFMRSDACRFWPPFTAHAGNSPTEQQRYVFEAPSMIRRNGWVYLFFSASLWTSPNYGVYFLAAPSVLELADGSKTRIAGQYVVPFTEPSARRHNFGHGAPVVAPDGRFLFAFHHMVASDGPGSQRRAFMARESAESLRAVHQRAICCAPAPITFVDVGDGRGDVWIEPIMPLVPAPHK